MEGPVDPKIQLKAFRDQLLQQIHTGEPAVERVFSTHKLVHSAVRSCLKSDIVDKMLWARCNIAFFHPGLPCHFACKTDHYGFVIMFEQMILDLIFFNPQLTRNTHFQPATRY